MELLNKTTYTEKINQYTDVEIGDLTTNYFRLHMKLKRWGEECSLSILWPTSRRIAPTLVEGNKVLWENNPDNLSILFYNKSEGFEFEIVLIRRPPTNIFTLHFVSEGLEFHYQPPLTSDDILRGCRRPDNVVGSYAVYKINRSKCYNNQEEADKYRCGKAFHIYRPEVLDAVGKRIWADLNINPALGTMTITIDPAWLAAAVYPLTIDPTFGHSPASQGASAQNIENYIFAGIYTGEVGTGTSMSAYLKEGLTANTHQYKMAVYSGNSPITNGITDTGQDVGTTGSYKTQIFTVAPTLAAVSYNLSVWGNNDLGDLILAYDSLSNAGRYSQVIFGAWPDPISWSNVNFEYSIYVTYAAGRVSGTLITGGAGALVIGGGGILIQA